jgi:site-specific DNA-cytosine methylase
VRQPNSNQLGLEFGTASSETAPPFEAQQLDDFGTLGACTWSPSVALDPKHRPQSLDEPASTVRRSWCFSPQEAHLLDKDRRRYRKLTVQEIAVIQGFDPSWLEGVALRTTDKVRAIGDAVPPPLARAMVRALDRHVSWQSRTSVEICAGAGGLASGAAAAGFEHLVLIDQWAPACTVLRSGKPWDAERVFCGSVADYDFSQLRGKVGLLSGGPPCQPWSQAGGRAGHEDPRDLLGGIHEVIAAVRPEAFVFENVPGLATDENEHYLVEVLARLRAPSAGVRYGVVSGLLNAADYGVPQVRRRVFIVGVRDGPSAVAFKILDAAAALATHRDPSKPMRPRQPWVTLREAFAFIPDPGGWCHWPF